MPDPDRAPWKRKHDDPSAPAAVQSPHAHFYPKTKDDLVCIVKASIDLKSAPCPINLPTVPQQPSPLSSATPQVDGGPPLGPVRAVGSHFALDDVALTYGWIVETDGLQKTLSNVIPPCLSQEALAQLLAQSPDDDNAFNYYHVEAGIKIFELYSRLDRQQTPYQSGQNWRNVIPSDVDPSTKNSSIAGQYWGLPTLGGAGGQSIVGAFSTGTHGADHGLPPIADAVQAIHLVGCDGNEYWIERVYGLSQDLSVPQFGKSYNLTDDAKLTQVLGSNVRIIRDQSVFNSVLVSAGRMGIIYSVVLKVTKQYGRHAWRWKDKWSNVKNWLSDPQSINWDPPNQPQGLGLAPNPPVKAAPHRYLVVVVNPNAMPDGTSQPNGAPEHTVMIEIHDTVTSSDLAGWPNVPANTYNWTNLPPSWVGRSKRAGPNAGNSPPFDSPDILNWLCAQPNLSSVITQLVGVYTALITATPVISGVGHAADAIFPGAGEFLDLILGTVDAVATFVVNALAPLQGTSITLYQLLEIIMNASLDMTQKATLIEWVNETLLGLLYSPREKTDIYYVMLDGLNYTDKECSGAADSLEVSFPAPSPPAGTPGYMMFIETIFTRLTQLESEKGGMLLPDGTQTDHAMAFAGYISLRFTRRTSATIGMQQWPTTCNIEIAGPKDLEGTSPFLWTLEADAVGMGATVHWGQRNDDSVYSVQQVEAIFGAKLDQWRNALSMFNANGRLTNFRTTFSSVRGLEVVQPKIGSFVAEPTKAVSFVGKPAKGLPSPHPEELYITWDATDNPPGTKLELRYATGGAPTPLPGLKGSMTIPFVFPSKISLVASYTAEDGIRRTDVRTPTTSWLTTTERYTGNAP